MLKVYMAARYDNQAKLRPLRDHLELLGIKVTSRWLDVAESDNDKSDRQIRHNHAARDLEDIRSCDILIHFTETPECGYTKGGRHYESGYADASGKKVVTVGGRENIFYEMFNIDNFDNFWDCVVWLLNNKDEYEKV